MIRFKLQAIIVFLVLVSNVVVYGQSLETLADELLATQYKTSGPGAAVLVAKDGKVLYRKAVGLANVELNVPLSPDNVFELGSITKQFTAVSILMLMEQGKLALQDEITKYLPDYPTNGKKITIHHLLNHTSGIKSYTDVASFLKLARTDMTPTQLIDSFKTHPMDFDPGTQWRYNNSGYIILGYIIEKVSGKSYANFIEENIFKKVGMTHSWYGSKGKIIPNRASGYQPVQGGFANAEYLSMTLPYAAGSLMSTVDDMLLWNQAVHNHTLITKESRQKAFTNHRLNNGELMYYGYGWSPNDVNGLPSVEHSGGIFGYTTMGVYIPDQNIYVIALSNSSGSTPANVAVKLAAAAAGRPYPVKPTITLTGDQLQEWVGEYKFENGILRTVSADNGQLYMQRNGGAKNKLLPQSPTDFIFDNSTTRFEFSKNNRGRSLLMKDRIRQYTGVSAPTATLPGGSK